MSGPRRWWPRPRIRSWPVASTLKLTLFAVVTLSIFAALAIRIGNVSLSPTRTYHALFTDATNVIAGDRVRLSGVEIGRVTDVELVADGEPRAARVSFEVGEDVELRRGAQLELRWENLIGQRYLAISQRPDDRPAAAGTTFGLGQTTPALNLTELFNGFQPLFEALDPDQVNEFSLQLIRALQGEAGTVAALMQDTADLTSTIADRDAVIGSVVTNFESVLGSVGQQDRELDQLILQFRDLMAGLADERDVVSMSLPALARMLDSTTGLLRDVRPSLRVDLELLADVAAALDGDRAELEASIQRLPKRLRGAARAGSYGSWFNYYVCGLEVELQLLDGRVRLRTPTLAANETDTVCGGGG